MSILCFFMMHKWTWITDFIREDEGIFGLYQCKNCKEISLGTPNSKYKPAMPMNAPNIRA